ncbi:hypothetical protein [Lishizhenia sp.]|uniref:hypothetical protein n=1 Tax=Lishizhenia sp. TaxID=2497594 RepID=UPI00299ECAF4|nr:hypothetical protein [Lishizhenia sp.]MDX1445592.1 hypothetical protein [Lishizhenia sp.]
MEKDILDDDHSEGIAVNYDLRKVLFKLINNSKFLGITFLVVASLYAVLCLFIFSDFDFLGIFIGVMVALVIFFLYYMFFHYLNTAANKMKLALAKEQQKELDLALDNLRQFFKLQGIIIICTLSILFLVFTYFFFNY